MSKRIFISRPLKEGSPFLSLKEKGIEIIDLSLIRFSMIPIVDYPQTDWIFFYSKNGVKYFFEQESFSTSNQYAVMGPGTAGTFFSITGHSPKYTGQGDPHLIADQFIKFESSKSILFVKAKSSKDSVRNLIKEHLSCHDIIVYDNVIKNSDLIPSCDMLVFTSPKNAEAYFSSRHYNDEKVIALGKTTESYLKQHIGINAFYCKRPSEENLFKLVKSHL